MKKILVAAAMVLAVGVGQAQAASITVATFADPALDSSTPVFSATNTAGIITLNGGWTANGLTLQVPALGQTYLNAQFSIDTLIGNNDDGTLDGVPMTKSGGGTARVTLMDSNAVDLLYIDFNRAWLNSSGVGNGDLLVNAGDIVDIIPASGPDIFFDPESFAFSFTNLVTTGLPTGTNFINYDGPTTASATVTASFTSSATVVPEPATMALFGLGLLGAGFARRRRT